MMALTPIPFSRHRDHETFVRAMRERLKLMISFVSQGEMDHELRLVAPVGVGPIARSRVPEARYHFFDYTGRGGAHPMALRGDHLYRMVLTAEPFDPADFARLYERGPRWLEHVEFGGRGLEQRGTEHPWAPLPVAFDWAGREDPSQGRPPPISPPIPPPVREARRWGMPGVG